MRLTKVDQLILGNQEHFHLALDDNCYFLGEYTAREGHSFSDVNQFILNFKKSMDRKQNPNEWRYKERAIREAANLLQNALGTGENLNALRSATLVPVPPSRAQSDPLYDDRIFRMLSCLNGLVRNLDIRQLVKQHNTYQASHSATYRLNPDQLQANYFVDETLATPKPSSIWIFDDLLVSGSHYKAMVQALHDRFPNAEFLGIFLARRVTNH